MEGLIDRKAVACEAPVALEFAVRETRAMAEASRELIIAVVDDDRSVLEALEDLLQSAGYRVRLFGSATALLESGSLADIDCLVSDIDLPRVDGFELLRLAKAARPELPVILLTGHADMTKRPEPAGARYFRLFKKPFDAQELLTAISDALRRAAPR